ncbi:hypothetical protein ES705_36981 [subsurface metagenome]
MSSISTSIRGLGRNFKRFFNIVSEVPVRVLTALRIVVSYENSMHRIVMLKQDFETGGSGQKLIKLIPVGEIWIPEILLAKRTSGETTVFDKFLVKRVGNPYTMNFTQSVTPAVEIMAFRGITFGEHCWLYPGDELYANVSVSSATDDITLRMQYRVMRVGDDL